MSKNVYEVADALDRIADALFELGNNHATSSSGTSFGAIEALSMQIEKGCGEIAEGLQEIARSLDSIANKMKEQDEN